MNARSALFDVYGDHLRPRGPAVSRMVRQGWLTPTKVRGASGYALTPRAVRRLDDAAARIYRTREQDWDGTWHLLVVSLPAGRSARDRVRAGLSFLGYGPLDESVWVAPRPGGEADALLAGDGARAERFTARHDGDSAALISRAWDLDGLARAYLRFLDDSALLAEEDDGTDRGAFVARSRLVHEWRKFLFLDPALPPALLPVDWPGAKAAAYFDAESARLAPGAARFVDESLEIE